jgi:hypothetical protein
MKKNTKKKIILGKKTCKTQKKKKRGKTKKEQKKERKTKHKKKHGKSYSTFSRILEY